jgi:hypothetical protein
MANIVLSDITADDYDFAPGAREHMAKCEREWCAAGLTVAWIDTRPKWLSITDWSWPQDCLGPAILTDPVKACRRTWRLSLIGGGQIRVTEHWSDRTLFPGDSVWKNKTTLAVAAHTDRVCHGGLGGACAEMSAHAVLLRGVGDGVQAVADRVAATFRALTSDDSGDCTPPERDRSHALLDGTRGCSICRRPLRDKLSKLLGVGPDCARTWNIPHSRAAASRRLELRAQMLGDAP